MVFDSQGKSVSLKFLKATKDVLILTVLSSLEENFLSRSSCISSWNNPELTHACKIYFSHVKLPLRF